jgi:hypothetical protein
MNDRQSTDADESADDVSPELVSTLAAKLQWGQSPHHPGQTTGSR